MKGVIVFFGFIIVCLGLFAWAGRAGARQNPILYGIVTLPDTSPGFQQTGNTNISGTGLFGARVGIGTNAPSVALDVVGTAKMSGFEMSTGASAGRVLQSDAAGHGTWKPDGIALPYSASVNEGNSVLQIINAGSGPGLDIRGTATSGSSQGIYSSVGSTVGIAVTGYASAATGPCYGGVFATFSSGGTGVVGNATDSSGSAAAFLDIPTASLA